MFCTCYILMALFLASTSSLKFGTFSVNVSGKLGIFFFGGGGGDREWVRRGGYVVLWLGEFKVDGAYDRIDLEV